MLSWAFGASRSQLLRSVDGSSSASAAASSYGAPASLAPAARHAHTAHTNHGNADCPLEINLAVGLVHQIKPVMHRIRSPFGAVYSAGSGTERVALEERPETRNRSANQIFTTTYAKKLGFEVWLCSWQSLTVHCSETKPRGRWAAAQQQAALQRQAARRQPAGKSGQPFRTPTAAGRRREGPRGRARPGR